MRDMHDCSRRRDLVIEPGDLRDWQRLAAVTAAEMPHALTFFVSAEQQALIEQALRAARADTVGDTGATSLTRGDLLAVLAQAYLRRDAPDKGQ